MSLMDFHFIRPWWLLAALPLALLLVWLIRRQLGRSRWLTLIDPALAPHVLIPASDAARRWPTILVAVIGMLGIIALAGPAWRRLPTPVFRSDSALVIALDLSRSMEAADIQPNRLDRARFKVADILKRRTEGQTALLVYAGDAFVVTPLTDDTATIAAQLSALSPDLMPIQGSRADLAFAKAQELLKQTGLNRGDILLITDGIDGDRAAGEAGRLRKTGYRLSILGVASEEGAPVPSPDGGFMTDAHGAIVVSRLDQATLGALARLGGGTYQSLAYDDRDLDRLLAPPTLDPMRDPAAATGWRTDLWREEGPWLLLLAIPVAALAFRRGCLALILLLALPLPQEAQAFDWQSLWLNRNQQASKALRSEDAAKAAELFTDPAWQGAARYRMGDFENALQAWRATPDTEVLYNRGNALARLGRYQEALEAYERALELDPRHEDAEYNHAIVKDALEQQQRQRSAGQRGAHGHDGDRDSPPGGSTADRGDGSAGQDTRGAGQESADGANESGAAGSGKGQDGEQDAGAAAEDEGQEGGDTDLGASPRPDSDLPSESQQATEQWLRRIPDDPGGLLRRKFYYQYSERYQDKPRSDEPW